MTKTSASHVKYAVINKWKAEVGRKSSTICQYPLPKSFARGAGCKHALAYLKLQEATIKDAKHMINSLSVHGAMAIKKEVGMATSVVVSVKDLSKATVEELPSWGKLKFADGLG